MKRLFLYLPLLCLPLLFAGCKKNEENDLKSIMTTQASQDGNGSMSPTLSQKDSKQESSSQNSTSKEEVKAERENSAKNIAQSSQTFTGERGKISYPSISSSGNNDEKNINTIIEDNAKSALASLSSNPDSRVEINYSIKNQNRNRMSILYTGSVKTGTETANIVFTNNIDLNNAKSIRLSNFADPLTIAGYILSDDLVLENATNEQARGFNEYKKTWTLDELKTLLATADFPADKTATGELPKFFSYESGGDIFICIPVSHELGDYVIAKFSPSSK